MEQVKVDFTRDKVAFVRAASQASLAKEPMIVGYYVNQNFNVRYVIYDNRIQNIIYDMSEMPNKDTLDIMQKFLSIDNIERVTITIPVDETIQVWRWNDLTKKVLDAEKEKEKVSNDIIKPKEVCQDGKSKEDNLQNQQRRNKIVKKCLKCKHFYVDNSDCDCCDKEDTGICEFEDISYEPLHVKYCKDCYFFKHLDHICRKRKMQVDSFNEICGSFIYVRKSYNH